MPVIDYFDSLIAYNPDTSELVSGATFQVFAPDDSAYATPLAVTDPASGANITTLSSSSVGVLPDFRVAGDPAQVVLKSGAFVTLLTSRLGVLTAAGFDPDAVAAANAAAPLAEAARDAAIAAREAAEAVPTTTDGLMVSVAANRESAFSVYQSTAIPPLVGQNAPRLTATATATRMPDMMLEWHHRPAASYLGTPWNRTYFGGISRGGDLLACYHDHDADVTEYVSVGRVEGNPNDHKVPVVALNPAGRAYVFWTNHNEDNYIRWRESSRSGVLSFGEEKLIDMGGVVSYVQAFWTQPSGYRITLFARVAQSTWKTAISDDGGATWTIRTVFSAPGAQLYMVAVPADTTDATSRISNRIRVALYGHPVDGTYHDVRTFTIHLHTGAIEAIGTPGVSIGNIQDGTSLPLLPSTGKLAYSPPANTAVRVFHMQPAGVSGQSGDIAIATWDTAPLGSATYKLLKYNSGTATYTPATIVAAGIHFGYTDTAKYLGGMWFAKPGTNTIFLAREDAGTWRVERYTYDSTPTFTLAATIATSSKKLVRPLAVEDLAGAMIYAELKTYGTAGLLSDYENFYADTMLVGF